MPQIELKDVKKTFADGTTAVHRLDFAFDEGITAILGPNGAGKTTLLSILVLALDPTSGTRRYWGIDAARTSSRALFHRIGYLPQDFAPLRHLTGIEYIVHCARLRGVRLSSRELRSRAHNVLDRVGLLADASRRCGDYSGGMVRRLGIAQAVVHDPQLLVVDEPTSGLDPHERLRFRNLICELAVNRAVILSTHICEDVEATASRVVIIGRGHLLFDGSIGSLQEANRTDVSRCTPFSVEQAYAAVLDNVAVGVKRSSDESDAGIH